MKISVKEDSVKVGKKMISLELPLELYEELRKACRKSCLGTSAIVRLAIISYLKGGEPR